MTIQFIKKDRYYIDFTCNENAKDEGLSFDIKLMINEYLNEFSSEIKSQLWDYFAVEFWFDSGQLIFFPEIKLDETPTEYDPYPADRLDPYLIVRLTSYLKKYDTYIDHNKFTESELEKWYFENLKEVFNSIDIALNNHELSKFILNSLNRKNIVFYYFGTSREIKFGEKTISYD